MRTQRIGGFTLVELVMVIMVTGIIAGSLTIFLKPAIESYFDSRRRADLTDIADTALRRMSQDIRSAVPNSVRSVSASCFQLAPTIAGGRYRMAADTTTTGSASVDTSTTTAVFDVLSPLSPLPLSDDWVVIGNQNGDDVYDGSTRGQIATVATSATGRHRITLDSPHPQFPMGYDLGRFVVVPNVEQTVTYSCVGNVLYRNVAAFGAADCTASGAKVATDVANCSFIYNPNEGATQQSGFVWMRLELSRSGESVVLAHGVHVDNVP